MYFPERKYFLLAKAMFVSSRKRFNYRKVSESRKSSSGLQNSPFLDRRCGEICSCVDSPQDYNYIKCIQCRHNYITCCFSYAYEWSKYMHCKYSVGIMTRSDGRYLKYYALWLPYGAHTCSQMLICYQIGIKSRISNCSTSHFDESVDFRF